jgi:pimeloyl-ACP methyl ester carboxylesterase
MPDSSDHSWTPTGVTTMTDGRQLAWDAAGDERDPAILLFHGFPNCRVGGPYGARVAQELRVRVISIDRPGFGRSTFQPDRRITDWPSDVAALADHLGLERYAVLGVSGGGPFALACAHAPDPRLAGATVVAGIGPMDTPELRASLVSERELMEAAAQGIPTFLPVLDAHISSYSSIRTIDDVLSTIDSMSTDEARVAREHPEALLEVMDSIRAAAENGIDGIAYEGWLTTRPWGFELSEIRCHVDFYVGDRDLAVPTAHVVDQAERVPDSSLTIWPGVGHLGFARHLPEVLASLRERLSTGS